MSQIPLIANPGAGTTAAALDVLCSEPRCEVRRVAGDRVAAEVRAAAAAGAERIVVAGGDGTIAAAMAGLEGSQAVLGVVPAGTLNHFAHDLQLPMEAAEALRVALEGTPTPVDLGSVNGRRFLNTSAVGAYVPFVRLRRRLQGSLGYLIASGIAGVVVFARLRSVDVEVEVDGKVRHYRSPLVFVGVGERELRPPKLGGRKDGGQRGLHLLIVRHTSRPRLVAMAFRMLVRRIRPWAGRSEVDSLLVERCVISLMRVRPHLAVDGEIVQLKGPLEYRIERDAVRVAVPLAGAGE